MRKIYLIDDNADDREWLSELVRADAGLSLRAFAKGRDALSQLADEHVDCILLDYRLDGEDALDIMEQACKIAPHCPVVVLTSFSSEDVAVEAMRAGASFYLSKQNATAHQLCATIKREADHAEITREVMAQRAAHDRANRLDAVGQMAAGIAHDFNNILATCTYGIDLLLRDSTSEKDQSRLIAVQSAVARGTQLSRRLLSFSRQDQFTLSARPLTETIAEMTELANASVGAPISVTFEPDLHDLVVYSDHGQLCNALLNLVLNARDAILQSDGGGAINITSKYHNHLGDNAGPMVEINVRDDGVGMTPETVEKCTDLFFTTRQNTNGSGLGLSLVQEFALKSGGELRIKSALGKGTEMKLILPLYVDVDQDGPT